MSMQRQIVLVGLEGVGSKVFHTIPKDWHITVVDPDLNLLERIPDQYGERNVTKICDNPSSRLVLSECGLQPSTLLAVMTHSDEMNIEVARIAREDFSVEAIFLVQNSSDTHCPLDNVTLLNTEALLTNRMSTYLRGTLSAANIGQERGEIRQITILNSSAARGQPLSSLDPKTWLIAAVYRNGELIIPHGDTILTTGDEVVVVGEPDILDTEISFLQGGQILFPSQYGSKIGVVDLDSVENTVNTVVSKTEALKYTPISFETIDPGLKSRSEIRKYLLEQEIGMIMLPPKPISWVARWGLKTSKIMSLMFNSQIPFWVDNQTQTIKKILLCIKNPQSLNVLGTVALDLARQFEAELTSLSISHPNVRSEAHEEIQQIPNDIQHLAHIHGVDISKIEVSGNPINEIINIATDFDLIVIGYTTHTRSTFNNPDITLHLFHQIRSLPNTSIVFIPWQTAGR